MPRAYTMSPAARAAKAANAAKARAAANSVESYVNRIVARAGELTPEHVEKLRALLPPVPKDAGRRAA